MKDWGMANPPSPDDETEIVIWEEAKIGLAFAQIKVDGCSEAVVIKLAIDALEACKNRMEKKHGDWPLLPERLSTLELMPDAASFVAALPAGVPAYGQLHVANQLSPRAGVVVGQRITYHLELGLPYPTLAAAFHQNHRRNLKKAAGLLVAEETTVMAVIDLFRATKGRELPDVKPRHYVLLGRLAAGLAARAQLLVVVARDPSSGELLAGGLFAYDTRQLIYLVGAVSEAGRARGAMHAVIDGVLRAEAGGGRRLDFEGSMVESVARFYAGFGARPVPYLTFQRP